MITLSPEQKVSGAWLTVKKYVEDRSAELRSMLEGDLNFEQTQCARKQLRELRRLVTELEGTTMITQTGEDE